MNKSRWTGHRARKAFIDAFADLSPDDKPVWLTEMRIAPWPHDGPNHIATAICEGGKEIRVKVLKSHRIVTGFQRDFPSPDMAVVVVGEMDIPGEIRWNTFKEVQNLR